MAEDDIVQPRALLDADTHVLCIRFKKGCTDYEGFITALEEKGWEKVIELTNTYKKNAITDDDYRELREVLNQFKAEGGRVTFGIFKYIPPNQMPNLYEGFDGLFGED